MEYEIITKYEWFYGYCEQAIPAIAVSVSIVISIKIVFNFIIALKSRSAKKAYKKGFEDGSKRL